MQKIFSEILPGFRVRSDLGVEGTVVFIDLSGGEDQDDVLVVYDDNSISWYRSSAGINFVTKKWDVEVPTVSGQIVKESLIVPVCVKKISEFAKDIIRKQLASPNIIKYSTFKV